MSHYPPSEASLAFAAPKCERPASLEDRYLPGESLPCGGAVSKLAASAGLEVRLYDPTRKPQNWTDFMHPDQCAVLFNLRIV
jgi:hypothetical protein